MIRNQFDNLVGGSRTRLAHMRAYVQKWNSDKWHSTRIDWHAARSHGAGSIRSEAHGLGFSDYGAAIPASALSGLRDAGTAESILNLRHSGYFADDYQDELYVGRVWQLPTRNGEPLYLAGYVERDSGYAMLCASNSRLETFDDPKDAARAADGLAERNAECEREYSERWRAATDLDDEIAAALTAVRSIRSAWKANLNAWIDARKRGASAAAGTLSCHMSDAMSRYRDAAEKVRELREKLSDFADVAR